MVWIMSAPLPGGAVHRLDGVVEGGGGGLGRGLGGEVLVVGGAGGGDGGVEGGAGAGGEADGGGVALPDLDVGLVELDLAEAVAGDDGHGCAPVWGGEFPDCRRGSVGGRAPRLEPENGQAPIFQAEVCT